MDTTTLRRMHKTGELIPIYVSKGGTRYYSPEQINDLINKNNSDKNKLVVGYCRVSASKQKEELNKQVKIIKEYMCENGYENFEIIEDIGSGIDYERKGFNRLIDKIEDDEISKIVVVSNDRLLQVAQYMFEKICKKHNVIIERINLKNFNVDEFIMDTQPIADMREKIIKNK